MKIHSRILVVTGILALFLAAFMPPDQSVAWTNPAWGTQWNNPDSGLQQTMIMNRAMGNTLAKGKKQQGGATEKASLKKQQAAVTFRPVAKMLVPEHAAALFAQQPDERETLEKKFSQLLDIFEQDAAREKQPNNIARATAFFVAAQYEVASGITPKGAQVDVFQSHFAESFLEDQKFRALSDKEKQEIYETFALYGMFALAGYTEGVKEKDVKKQEQFRDFARQSIMAVVGVPAEKLQFCKTGLIVRDN